MPDGSQKSGLILFSVMIGFNLMSTVTTARIPRGDYYKARRALHPMQE